MVDADRVKLNSAAVGDVEDQVLDALCEAEEARARLFSVMGGAPRAPGESSSAPPGGPAPLDPEGAYELEVAKPQAYDLRRLRRNDDQPVFAAGAAALGASVPVLLSHIMTPFPPPGESPGGIWGMGYKLEMEGLDDASTVDWAPKSELLEVIKVNQTARLGISLGGKVGLCPQAALPMGAIPGLKLNGVSAEATTDQEFSLAIHVKFAVVKALAGPVGAGGVRWQIYRQDESLTRTQVMLQTLLIPEGTEELRVTVHTWLRRRGLFFDLIGSRQWTYPPQSFTVSLQGLDVGN